MENRLPWSIRHKPEKLIEVVGQSKSIHKLVHFTENFPQRKRALLIYGPTGVGKTAAVYAFAAERSYEIIELNSSDFRNAKQIEEILEPATKQMSLFSTKKIILIDELDGISGVADRGGLPAIVKIIKETSFPIVLIANNPWESKFRTLRLYCDLAEFTALDVVAIADVLKRICQREGVSYVEIALKKLASASNGDVRAAINDLQIFASGKDKIELQDISLYGRDYEEKIFNALRLIFKSFDSAVAVKAVEDLTMDYSMLTHWLDQNISGEYQLPVEKYRAYRALADADIFGARVMKRQHWAFMRYAKFFLSAGVQQAKEQARGGFQSYAKPDMTKIFIRAAKRKKAKAIAANLSSEFHASGRTIQRDFFPYFNYMREANPKLGREIDEFLEKKN